MIEVAVYVAGEENAYDHFKTPRVPCVGESIAFPSGKLFKVTDVTTVIDASVEFLKEQGGGDIPVAPKLESKPEAKFCLNACDIPKGATHYRAVDGGIRFYRLSSGCVKSKTGRGWGVTLDGNNINAWLKKLTPIT